jgi:zinc/manganese transport system substrate-binding protein
MATEPEEHLIMMTTRPHLLHRWAFVALCALLPLAPAHAALRVLACEPEWAALTQELGGDLVDVSSATTAQQDPHQIQARPSLIARARNADLLVCTGAELEVGWLPVLLRQSGNARIQRGQPGHFAAADLVTKLDVPTSVDRSQGDVHAAGNPHIQLDPRNIAKVADALAATLQKVDAAHAVQYQQRAQDFARRWQAALARWGQQAAPLRGLRIAAQHKAYAYLEDWLGLQEVAVLEPKPGVEPSAAHLQQLLTALKATPAKLVMYSAYQDPKASDWLSRNAGIPAVRLAFTVGGNEQAKDLFGLFDDTVARLLAAANAKAP